MTLDQLKLYMASVSSIQRAELRTSVIAATAGARYDEKSLERLYRELEDK
jgi:hypothetical protein